MQLEDDILCFLPTVSDIGVFGCEVDLIDFATQLPLPAAFHTALMQQRKLQIVVRPCMVEGHSIWQFQEGDRESYPTAVRFLSIHSPKLTLGSCGPGLCSVQSKGICGVLFPQQSRRQPRGR